MSCPEHQSCCIPFRLVFTYNAKRLGHSHCFPFSFSRSGFIPTLVLIIGAGTVDPATTYGHVCIATQQAHALERGVRALHCSPKTGRQIFRDDKKLKAWVARVEEEEERSEERGTTPYGFKRAEKLKKMAAADGVRWMSVLSLWAIVDRLRWLDGRRKREGRWPLAPLANGYDPYKDPRMTD